VTDLNATGAAARVTVVSVCYNSLAVLPDMLASVPAGTPVVLVDNASRDVAALTELAEVRGATLLRNAENRGFGPACNQGAAIATTEFLLFLNPDAALQPGAIEALVAAAARYPDFGAMNPRILNADGSPYFKRGSVLVPKSAWLPRGWPAADRVVPVLTGAAFFVRRADFEAVGGFDPAIFLYHEDDDLALRLQAARGPLYFIHDAAVRHMSGHSTTRSPQVAALKAWHMGRSRVYAARKHRVPMGATRAIVQASVQLASPLCWLSARKRAKQWAFFKGVLAQSLGQAGAIAG
jgi:N-acetylglucosaminyl-diphospho-decaprenol L-rhamnosyltransferase